MARYELAVAFALTLTAQTSTAVFSVDTEVNPPVIWLKDTLIDWQKPGYIYKLPAIIFSLIAPNQWVAYEPIVPLEIIEIDPENYRSWIKLQ